MSVRFVLAGLGMMLATAAPAQDHVVIYRCTDAAGHVTLQNDVACPAGARQQREVVDVPPPLPAYVPRDVRMPDVVAKEHVDDAAALAHALPPPVPPGERKPPPALYQCRTWDNLQFFTEDAQPQSRCAPLQVVAIAGKMPAASACEQVTDTCVAVPEDALCLGWKRRVDEAEFRWKFAGALADDARRFEYEKLAATYANSTCQKP